MTSRSLVQRTCVIAGLIAVAASLFYIGRGHTLLIDTNAVTIGGAELRSFASATVSVDGKELGFPLGRAERDMVTVSGPKHRITIVNDADPAEKIEKTFTIPTFMDMAIVSVPAIIGNAPREYWVTLFTPAPAEDAPAEQMHYQSD